VRIVSSFCVASIVVLASFAPVPGASELWLQPDPPAPLPGQSVVVRVMRGEPFAGEEERSGGRPRRIWKRGRQEVAADFRPAEPGIQLIVHEEPERYAKAIVVVGQAPTDDPIRYSEVGHRLEIVPQSDPVLVQRRGGELEVQVLFEHEPLAGVIVTALPEAAPRDGRRTAVTDEIGLARFRLDRPGTWMVRVAQVTEGVRATLIMQAGDGS